MGTARLFLIGVGLMVYYIFIWLIFFPTRVLLVLGRARTFQKYARSAVLFSDTQAHEVRDDLAQNMAVGAERVLEYHHVGHLPSRHQFRREGLKSARSADSQLSSGEFLVSAIVVVLGLLASVFTIVPNGKKWAAAILSRYSIDILGIVSVATAVIGFLILVLVFLRNAVVSHLLYDDSELSVGERPELLMKMTWNSMVARNPAKVLKGYYLLRFGDLAGDRVYSVILSTLTDAMDPELGKWEVMKNRLPDLIKATQDALESK